MIIVAHPDDETIGAGGLLARSIDAHVVMVTDGAPADSRYWGGAASEEEYAAIRRSELLAALGEAGIGADRLHLIGLADREVVRHIPALVDRLDELLDRIEPDIVLTMPYEGSHVDHDATALAVHAALARRACLHPHEIALYSEDASGIVPHSFLPADTPMLTVHLTPPLSRRKAAMLARYASQQQYRDYFQTDVERYRCAPAYDFRWPPAQGPLLYERGDEEAAAGWRTHADAALDQLRPPRAEQAPSSLTTGTALPPHPDALVSVIVRTTGRATLDDALRSLACQTHPSLEVVLVDVAGQHAGKERQLRPGATVRVVQGIGLGRAAALNAGLAAATGRYLAFLDDDDWYHPEHLSALVAALQAAPDAQMAYASVEAVECLDNAAPCRRWVFDTPYDPVTLLCENYIPLNAFAVERALLADEQWTFDESLGIYEDWDFLIWLSRRTRFEPVRTIGAVYRWPPGSGVNDPTVTGGAQARIYAKWRNSLTAEEYVGVLRRAIRQTEVNDRTARDLRTLQQHLEGQDEELRRARSVIETQENQLSELRAHLTTLDSEILQLRAHATAESKDIVRLRAHVADVEGRLAAAQSEVNRITGSWSWRVTRPARALRSLVRGAMGTPDLHGRRE
jgi:LmbE family N-acetylglucosaminyl deacetylase/glycosyltransferase involved in cell wall biosynthesis